MVVSLRRRDAYMESPVWVLPPNPGPLAPVMRALIARADPARGTVVGVTSAIDGEGKTTVARDLALGLSRAAASDQTVLLVDGWQTVTDVTDQIAWMQTLAGSPLQYQGLRALERAGAPLDLPSLPASLTSLRARHGFVILDLPAVLYDPLAPDLARAVDRLYLVVRSGVTNIDLVQQTVTLLGQARIEGVILNDVHGSLPEWLQRLVP
jgi:Mrp family chromosome partitioning ATPase